MAWLLIMSCGLGCSWEFDREACRSDGDCGKREVCYYDNLCVPVAVAVRRGAEIGDECSADETSDVDCSQTGVCRMGFCRGSTMDAGPDADTGDAADAADDAEIAICTEGTPEDYAPLFGGITDAVADGGDAVVLRWLAAADESPPEDIVYLIFTALEPGGQDFTAPAGTVTGTGERTFRMDGLTEGLAYHFVVRARDDIGQTECNTVELSATPVEIIGCVDYATHIQPLFDAFCIACHRRGAEEPAPRELFLESHADVLAGGLTGSEIIACQADSSLLYMKIALDRPPVGRRMPLGGPYLLDPQTRLIRMWIEQGAFESCPSDPTLCADTMPPSFAGLTTAMLMDATTAELCWTAGSDTVTPPAGIFYDVFEADASGGHDFMAPPLLASPPGATCVTRSLLEPGMEYCWIVRARDAAGNRDGNTVERCLAPP